ncbi:MAG: hypothetical protein ACYTGN_10025 [Planctomycetota bacterium]|jgi:hypothetical protein
MTRRKRRILIGIGLVLIASVAAAPLLAGTGLARSMVERGISEALGREARVGAIDAGWGSGVRISDLVVANRAEFGAAPLLEARSIELDQPLHEILFGAGTARVRVRGAVVRIEERGTGRTNVDDLVGPATAPRPRVPRPPGPPRPPRKPPRPVDIRLIDCALEVRHLPRRPRGFDPFREDPEIADAVELTLALSGCDLRLHAGRLDFGGDVTVNGQGGRVTGHYARDGGRVVAAGFDLGALSPLLPETLSGTLDLSAKLAGKRFEVRASAVETRGEVHLTGRGELDGRGEFALEGHGPRRLLLRLLGRPPREGTLHFDLGGTLEQGDVTVTGSTRVEGLGTKGTLRFELGGDSVRVEGLEVETDELYVKATGRVGADGSFDLSGEARGDLGALRETLGTWPDERLPDKGQVDAAFEHCTRAPNGDLVVRAVGSVDGRRFALDAELLERGDRLDLRHGRLGDLVARGVVEGVRAERPRKIRGSLKGPTPLAGMVADALGVPGLAGAADLDVAVDTTPDGLTVEGRADIRGFRLGGAARERVELKGRLVRLRGNWSGGGRVVTDGVAGTAKVTELRRGVFRGGVTLDALDLAVFARQFPRLNVDRQLRMEGKVAPVLRVARENGLWNVRMVVPETRLSVGRTGFGIEAQPVSFSATFTERKTAWEMADADLTVGDARLRGSGLVDERKLRFRGEGQAPGVPLKVSGRRTDAWDMRFVFKDLPLNKRTCQRVGLAFPVLRGAESVRGSAAGELTLAKGSILGSIELRDLEVDSPLGRLLGFARKEAHVPFAVEDGWVRWHMPVPFGDYVVIRGRVRHDGTLDGDLGQRGVSFRLRGTAEKPVIERVPPR